MMPKPIFIETRGETGLETLIDAGQLPETPHLPELDNWQDLMDALTWVRESEHNYRTLCLDALNGAERLMHEMVCQRDFNGDWTDRGFMGYQRGFEVALADWRMLLSLLDSIRAERRMTIALISHTRVQTFKNPAGADFDRYQPDLHPKTWALTSKWCDVILFGNFEVVVGDIQGKAKKGKAIGQNRMLYTDNHAAYEAKNRLGLVPEIEMGNSAQEAWANFKAAVMQGRQNGTASSETSENGGTK
jgi:hypothetical protein